MPLTRDKAAKIAVCLILVVIVGLAFGRSLGADFVNYDDSEYVYENPHITSGVSLTNVWWAFSHIHAANWHPLSTISHMIDCQIYGLRPWGHHLTNVVLHALAAVLLFLALCELTKSLSSQRSTLNYIWPSAFVAALFAVHPLRVESVVWISERKDVLSGVFFMLTLFAYARYARADRPRLGKYFLVVGFFALGLMSKPTLVTLPFVLLLLDCWPLQRMQGAWSKERAREGSGRKSQVGGQKCYASAPQQLNTSSFCSLIVEKVPLFVLAGVSCVITIFAQKKVIAGNLRMNFLERLSNALITYVAYLGEMVWPSHLVVSHPYAEKFHNLPQAVASLLLITAVSVVCLVWRKRYPFLLVGWLWYLGMLVPMIGLVQVSTQARADRYTYLPQIGVYLAIAMIAVVLIQSLRIRRRIVAASAFVIVLVLICCSYTQARYWRDTETLWRHALDSSTYDYIAHDSLGYALLQKGEIDQAITEYRRALEIKPDYADSHNNLGNALLQKGFVDEATEHYRRALEIEPEFAEPHNNLGNVLFKQNRIDEAIEQYKIAAAKRPDFAEVQCNLGNAFIVKGDWDQAISYLRAAIRTDNHYAQAHDKLGVALAASGKADQALAEFQEALRLDPNYAEAHFNLGYLLAHSGRHNQGVEHLLKAVHLRPNYPEAKQELRQLGIPLPR